jgi:hypothetical protein
VTLTSAYQPRPEDEYSAYLHKSTARIGVSGAVIVRLGDAALRALVHLGEVTQWNRPALAERGTHYCGHFLPPLWSR